MMKIDKNNKNYLTENKLGDYLSEIFKGATILKQIKMDKYRFDYFVKDLGIIVEFDGFFHYTDSDCIRRDKIKQNLAKDFKIVNWPYWIQINTETVKYYLNMDFEIEQVYPHGFIDKNVHLPSNFCELGIVRFKNELLTLPENIKSEVRESLKKKAIDKSLSMEYVVPGEIRNLFNI